MESFDFQNRTDHTEEKKATPICELTYDPDTRKITIDGKEYPGDSRIESFTDLARIIKRNLPPVPEGHTRLWRGNRSGEVGKNPSFTNSLEGIALPFWISYGGELSYIDVPQTELEKYENKTGAAEGCEFILPAESARKASVVNGLSNPNHHETREESLPEAGDPHGWTMA